MASPIHTQSIAAEGGTTTKGGGLCHIALVGPARRAHGHEMAAGPSRTCPDRVRRTEFALPQNLRGEKPPIAEKRHVHRGSSYFYGSCCSTEQVVRLAVDSGQFHAAKQALWPINRRPVLRC